MLFNKPVWDFREGQGLGEWPNTESSRKPSATANFLCGSSIGALLTKPRRKPASEAVEFEALEQRILLSADLSPFAFAMAADQDNISLSHDDATDMLQIHDALSGQLYAEQLRSETSSIAITGSEGDDRLTVDLAGSYIFPGGVMFDGAGGTDELVGPDLDSSWIIDGIDEGTLNGQAFEDFELVTGGADNEDVFRILSGGQITGEMEGGDGGFDTFEAIGTGLSSATYIGSSPDSGAIILDGLRTDYDGFEPAVISGVANVSIVLEADNPDSGTIIPGETSADNNDAVLAKDDVTPPMIAGDQVFQLKGDTFEDVEIQINDSATVSIDLGVGMDRITVSGIQGSFLDGDLTILGGAGDDTFILDDSFGDIIIEGGADSDTIDVQTTTPTVQIGNQLRSIDGDVTLQDTPETITGDQTLTILGDLRDGVNQAFDQVIEIADQIETGAGGAADFLDVLPLISGSTVTNVADVTLAKMAAFGETLKDVRFKINEAFDTAEDAGNDFIDTLQAELEDLLATVKHLGPGIIPDKTGVLGELTNLIGLDPSSETDGFRFKIVADLVGGSQLNVDLAGVDFKTIDSSDGADFIEKLSNAVNASIGATELAGTIVATARDGRLAFQAIGSDVEAFAVRGLDFFGANLANSVLGYSSILNNILAVGDEFAAFDVQEALTSLGENLIDLSGVNIDFDGGTSYSFDFDFSAKRVSDFGIDLGTNASAEGLSFDASAKLETTFALLAGLELAVDVGTIGDATATFTGTADLGAGFDIDAAVNADANFGFLAVEASGTVLADAGLQAGASASLGGTFNAADFVDGVTFNVVGFDPVLMDFEAEGEDGAAVAIDFTASIASLTGTLSLAINVMDMFGTPDPMVTFTTDGGNPLDLLDEFSGFSNLSPTQVIQSILSLIGWLDDLADSPIISGIDIPLVEGGLEQILDFAGIVSDTFLFDKGGDGVVDGADRLLTDLNSALAGAGLDQYLRAEVTGAGFAIKIIDDRVTNVDFGDDGLLSILGFGGAQNNITDMLSVSAGAFLASMVGGAAATPGTDLKSRIRVSLDLDDDNIADEIVERDLSITAEAFNDNRGIGDDATGLLDAFNSPLFSSATELAELLKDLDILPSLGDFGYNPDNDQLTYVVAINDAEIFDVELGTDFEIDLAPILEIETNSRLILQADGSINFVLGFDLSDSDVPGETFVLDKNETLENNGFDIEEFIKINQAITGEDEPNSIKGLLTADATFEISIDGGTSFDPIEVLSSETVNFNMAEDLEGLIQTKLDAALGENKVVVDIAKDSNDNEFLKFTGDGTVNNLEIKVATGNPAIQGLGLQPSQVAPTNSGGGATLTGLLSLPEYVGILTGDEVFTLTVDGVEYEVTVAAESTLNIDGDDNILALNRNVIDLIADVEAALADAMPTLGSDAVDLRDEIDVSFQGSRLVLTSTADVALAITYAENLGFTDGQISNSDDIIVRIAGDDDIKLNFDTITNASTLQELLDVFNAALGLNVDVTADDPSTGTDEGGKSLTLTFTGTGDLLGVEATNGSPLAAALGLVGLDANPLVPSSVNDETIVGSPIGGIELVDRFFISDSNPDDMNNELGDVFSFSFNAIFGRKVEDIRVGAGQNKIISDTVDLRDFVGDFITIKDVNGFTAGDYEILSVAEVGDDVVATLDGNVVSVASEGLAGGVGTINSGFDAGASLGFIDISLEDDTGGASTFGAELSLGFNTATGTPGSNQLISLGELIENFTEDETDFLTKVSNIIAPPKIEWASGDDFGGVDLTLDVSVGSADFADIASTFLSEISSPNFSLDLLALGDPFLGVKFANAGIASNTATQIELNMDDFSMAIAEGAKIQFDVTESESKVVGVVSTISIDGRTIGFEVNDADGTPLDLTNVDIDSAILLPTIKAELPDFGAIGAPDFSNFGIEEIIQLLDELVDILSEIEGLQFLNQKIPVIDLSVTDLFSFADDIATFVDEFQANPAGSLQFVEDAINDAIGFGSGFLQDIAGLAGLTGTDVTDIDDPFDLGLMFDSVTNEWMLTFEFTLGAFFNQQLPVGFDLQDAFGGDFSDLVRLAGSANLQASGGVLLQLGLGLDIDEFVADPSDVLSAIKVLEESTSLRANLSIGGTDLAFTGGLGPFTLAVRDSAEGGAAEVQIDLSVAVLPTFSDIIALSDLGFEDFDVNDGTGIGNTNYGTISGNLPIFAPTDSSYAGAIKIGQEVAVGAGDILNIDDIQLITDGTSPDLSKFVIDVSEIVDFVSNFNPLELSLFDQIVLAVDAFDGFLDLLGDDIFGNLAELDIPLVGDALADAASFIRDFQDDFVGPLRTAIEDLKNAVDDFTIPDKNIISNLLFDLLGPGGLDLLVPLASVDHLDAINVADQLTPGLLTAEDYIALDSDALAAYIDGEEGATLQSALIAWDFALGDPIEFDMQGNPINPLANPGIGFDLGIPGLGLETNGSLALYLGWELALGFGLSGKDGFFFNVGKENELTFDFIAQVQESLVDEPEIRGTLGFLELSGDVVSRDIDNDGIDDTTEIRAKFAVDISDGGATEGTEDAERLGFTELGNTEFTFGAYAKASAVLDLRLGLASDLVGASVASGLPSVVAGFNFLWEFGDENNLVTDNFGDALSDSLQLVAFSDVGIDAGEFLSDVLKPIVDKVAEVTGPLQPIIDFLTTPLPPVAQLGLNLTILDIAGFFGDVNADLIKSIAEVISVINTIGALPDDIPSLIIPIIGNGNPDDLDFGDEDLFVIFASDELLAGTLSGANLGTGFANPFDTSLNSPDARSNLLGQQGGSSFGDLANGLLDKLGGLSPSDPDEQQTQSTLQNLGNNAGEDKVFRFPWLDDPTTIFNLLLGEPLDLVIVDLQPLELAFEWSQFFSIFGPLGVSITLEFEAMADFFFGFDTQGIQDFVETGSQNPALILNGLYVGDVVDGVDVPEVTLLGGITAAAELNLGIARAGVAGGLFIEILFNLFDPNDDGKVRITELIQNVENQLRAGGADAALAPLAIFDVTGEIFARLFAFLKIDFGLFELDKEFPILDRITILEFSIDFFRPPIMATEQDNGDLVVNVGTFAEQRLLGDTSDFNENIRVEKIGMEGDFVEVAVYSENATTAGRFGDDAPAGLDPRFTYKVLKGQRIVIDAGDRNDDIEIIGFNGTEVEFVIDGGGGNDSIVFSGPPMVGGEDSFDGFHSLTGGAGQDTIMGSLGTDLIVGGAGNDDLSGGDGDDLIFGDTFALIDDTAKGRANGSDGDDTLAGDMGNDIIFGSGGRDSITGGEGNDLILADGGEVAFGAGLKKIAGNVLDLWNGAVSDADLSDVIHNDNVDAGAGNDIVFAGGGDDTVEGGANDDVIFAGEGSDTVTETSGVNIIFGDLGQFTGAFDPTTVSSATNFDDVRAALEAIVEVAIPGFGAGRDTITGGSDEDLIYAGEGNDSVMGEGGTDLIYLGGGADEAYGGAGGDLIFGEAGPDDIFGEAGNDILDGGSGPDSVEGGGGDDQINVTKGQDTVIGGTGDDAIRVYFQGGRTSSDITIDGGSEADTLLIFGTIKADDILLRADINGDTGFIANILGEFNVERANYNDSIERIIVNGGLGDDYFAVDDTASVITLNGGIGDDKFQIGQLYRTDRLGGPDLTGGPENGPDGRTDSNGIATGDEFRTIAVTRGFLSYGISEVLTANGGLGNDEFIVFHNAAVLQLNGDSGDDEFTVRAFALVGSQEPLRERTDLSGGAGADLVRYAVNAPVNIDGGDGFDTLIVIGTEFGDDFVITDEGVFGAGLNVNFVNIENLRVDGAEGNDRFFVQSTKETFLTEIFGGLGEDTFFMSGDTPPVVSNDLRGHSGIVAHEMESTVEDSVYNGQNVFGISANVADDEEPFAVITPSGGTTTITEGDTAGDTYTIVLTRQPTKDVRVFVAAPVPSPDGKEKGSFFFRLFAPTGEMTADGSGATLTFDDTNWHIPQEITVIADADDGAITELALGAPDDDIDANANDADRLDTLRLFTRDDLDPKASSVFDFDDDAFEGTTTGISVHSFQSRDTAIGTDANFISFTNGDNPEVVVNSFAGFTPDDLIGHRFKITSGPAAVEERLIIAASINAGELTLTLNNPYQDDNKPDDSASTYEIIVDDAVRGRFSNVDDNFKEVVAEEIFDDRTFVNIGSDAIDDLIGRVFEITSGPGAGQSAMVLSVGGSYEDAEGNAIGGAGWIELNAKFETDPTNDSLYRMKLYDGLAAQVNSVTINDNDTPSIVSDQTSGLDDGAVVDDVEDITAVIEGSDGDARGEEDIIKFRLNKMPDNTVTVTVKYDPLQLDLDLLGATKDADLGTLTFDIVKGDWDVVNNIEVAAADDIIREGAHSSLVEFSFASGDGDTPLNKTEIITVDPDIQSASVGLSFVPTAVTQVIVGGDDITNFDDQKGELGWGVIDNKIIFYSPAVTPGPFDIGGSELVPLTDEVEVTYSYSEPGFQDAFAAPILVRIADDDAPTLLVRETDGSTNVIETDGYTGAGEMAPTVATDSYELVLTGAPAEGETVKIYVDDLITKTTKTGGIRHDEIQVNTTSADDRFESEMIEGVERFFVTFDASDWDDAIVINVEAVNDDFVDGGDTKVFAPGPATLAGILGPVVVNGEGGNGSLSGLADPLMLPGEINVKPAAGNVLELDNVANTITVNRSDINAEVMHDLRLPGRIAADDMPPPDGVVSPDIATDADLDNLIDKTLEIVRAPAAPSVVDQFRLIIGYTVETMGTDYLTDDKITFTLNAPYDLATDEDGMVLEDLENPAQAGALGFPLDGDELVNRYAITSESLNFFVKEEELVDRMIVNDTDSPADIDGFLTATRLYGLNMGPDLVIGGQVRQGGITYGNLEVLDINLGRGFNDFNILGTMARDDGFKTWTIVNGGDDVPYDHVAGNGDSINAFVTNNDVVHVDERMGDISGENPSNTNGFEVVVELDGEEFDDGLLVGSVLTLINEDQGESTVFERVIREHFYDSGNNKTVLFLDAALPVTEGGAIDIDGGTLWSIVNRADGGLAINGEGGDDVIDVGMDAVFEGYSSDKAIVAFGGAGDDTITGGLGEDILFGDVGRVDYENDDGAIITRLGSAPEPIFGKLSTPPIGTGAITLDVVAFDPNLPNETGDLDLPVSDASNWPDISDPSETADSGLVGLFVDINNGTGFRQAPVMITANAADSFTVAEAFTEGFDDTTRYRISTLPEDQTDGFDWGASRILAIADFAAGNDVISGGGGDDIVIGGEGEDTLSGNADDDRIFGDLGVMELERALGTDAPVIDPLTGWNAQPTRIDNARSIELLITQSNHADVINGNEGGDLIFGGQDGDNISGDEGEDTILGDAGYADYVDGILTTIETYPTLLSGAADTILGGTGNDIILGGLGGDILNGNEDVDTMLGDHGRLNYTMDDNLAPTSSYLETVVSALDGLGGADTIGGDDGEDVIFGGFDGDTIDGDANKDLILGDNGVLTLNMDGSFDMMVTTDEDPSKGGTLTGGSDTVNGGSEDDIIVGGTDGDRLSGNADDDLILGDYATIVFGAANLAIMAKNFTDDDADQRFLGGDDTIFGNADDDLLVGAAGDDLIDGDADRDMIFGDNVTLTRDLADLTYTDPRFRTLLAGEEMFYGTGDSTTFGNGLSDHAVFVSTDSFTEPGVPQGPWWRTWTVDIQDHNLGSEAAADAKPEARRDVGNDYIAGGTEEDMIFGQLGDDVIQGDGSIDSADDDVDPVRVKAERNGNDVLNVTASFETDGDADDYIEGNGGADIIFGNLGQDDIIGDNSDLFSLGDASERAPVGSDIIFGGSGLRIDRHEYVETSNGDADTDAIARADRHSRDSDMILGDNGRIFRIITDNAGVSSYEAFEYDQNDDNATEHYGEGDAALTRSDAQRTIVVRAADLIDYTLGGADFDAAAAASDKGAGDEIHGETGDDFLYGMVGDDILFGDSDDDDIIGGQDNDWISGGTGQDGVIGGDGRIFTSKNSESISETLNGVGTVNTEEFISTPGKIQQSTIHLTNEIKKTVDLTPFFALKTGAAIEKIYDSIDRPVNDNDIIFGGLGSDFLHGGFGDDAISGAEAMSSAGPTPLLYSFENPGNPGDILNYGGGDGRPNEFAAYDEFNPRPEVFVDPTNGFVFVDPSDDPNAVPFVLNFDPNDGATTDPITDDGSATATDGDDRIFGDLGNDWMVGGTGRDHIFGGFGDDLLNADDDHDAGGANDTPDTSNSYADIAYGGAGRDVLIGNTGGDRLIDWVGEFNSYLVPFAPFGAFTISRNVQPQIYEYLYDLSAADGADPTRDIDGEVARNGEPYGEIGAVKQQDAFWQDQTGGPDDPQPGNIPGGKRDVMAAEDFNGDPGNGGNGNNALIAFAADSGTWSTQGGKLTIAPEAVGSDAVSVYHISNVLPVYFEMTADIAAAKDRFGYDSNGFFIFDYYAQDDFKFAGINQDINKIQIGHRDASGWHVDVQTNNRLRADTFYNLLVAVNGTTVTAVVDGKNSVTHTFAPRIEDGLPQAFNKGYIGLGSDNSFTTIENFIVQVLPPDLSYSNSENFEDGVADDFTGVSLGNWAVNAGRYDAVAGEGEIAYSIVDLSDDAGLAAGTFSIGPNSKVKLSATLSVTDQGGILFDMVSEHRFKFAVLDAAADQVILGYVSKEGNWTVVKTLSAGVDILVGEDYDIELLLAGSTVSVTLDDVFVGSHQFNALTVDGEAGVLARNGAISVDDFVIETDDAAIAVEIEEQLMASAMGTGGNALDVEDLQPVFDEAVRRLSLMLGLTDGQLALLNEVDLQIADLEGATLAQSAGTMVTFDVDAAGHGYFVDETLSDDEEFGSDGSAVAGSGADGQIDLLTVMMHELGHVLGFDHVEADAGDGFMTGMLDPSQRLGLLDSDNDDVPPTAKSETAMVYDERVGGMVTEDEALLLDMVEDAEPMSQNAPIGAGKKKSVMWAAE